MSGGSGGFGDFDPRLVHGAFETLAYVVAFGLVRRDLRRGDPLDTEDRWILIATAILGAVLGAKLLHHAAYPARLATHWHEPSLWIGGKTIVGALLGGWLAVEAAKRPLGIHSPTGDVYAVPLALGIAIGRFGCFLSGVADDTHGQPTSLPWGVDLGDGVPRHPVQLYEIAFLVALIPWLRRLDIAQDPGVRFRAFVLLYCAFRLMIDTLKPQPPAFAGLSVIQWACLAAILIRWRDVPRFVTFSRR